MVLPSLLDFSSFTLLLCLASTIYFSSINDAYRVMCCASSRTSRFVVEECLKWANQRQVFGKTLLHQPVIRQKLAKMIALVEACQSWLENVTNAMCNMNYKQQSEHLAGMATLCSLSITPLVSDFYPLGRGFDSQSLSIFFKKIFFHLSLLIYILHNLLVLTLPYQVKLH